MIPTVEEEEMLDGKSENCLVKTLHSDPICAGQLFIVSNNN